MTEVKKNFYAVAAGRKTGIFQSWATCNKQVKQFSGECYEGFTTLNEAVNFMVSRGGYDRDNITVFDKKGATECPLEEYIKQNDEQCSEPKLVVNELLAYVFYHLDRYPVNNIANVILQFYHADMIYDAKRILWDNYGDDLPTVQKRTNKGHKSAAEKDIEDVMDSVKLLDAKYSDKDLHLPYVFVAANLSKLPNVTPGEIEVLSLLERVSRLERQMAHVCAPQKQTYAGVASPTPSGTKPATAITSATDVSNSSGGARPKDTSLVNYAMPLNVALPPLPNEQSQALDADAGFTLQPAQLKKQRRQRQMDAETRSDTRSKIKPVYGTRQGSTLRAGPRRHDLFVFRIDKDITDEMFSDYLKESQVNVHELECVSQDGSWTKSYRVTVECNNINDILNPEFWPDGIGCRRFWRKKVTDN